MTSPSDSETDVPDLPGRSRAEIGAGLARAAISSVPLVGGAAAELFDLVLAPSLERRRDEWMGYLGEAVEELRERLDGFDPRDLEGNEQFVSSVLAASTLAMRTHQTEKLRMLRNAIVNSVLPGAPDDYEQMAFLRYVDELTPLHARVLAFVADPRGWFERHGIEQPTFMAAGLSTIVRGHVKVPTCGHRKSPPR